MVLNNSNNNKNNSNKMFKFKSYKVKKAEENNDKTSKTSSSTGTTSLSYTKTKTTSSSSSSSPSSSSSYQSPKKKTMPSKKEINAVTNYQPPEYSKKIYPKKTVTDWHSNKTFSAKNDTKKVAIPSPHKKLERK